MIGYGFHPDAQRDFVEAIQFYRKIDPRLAEDFITAIDEGILAIRANPRTWRALGKNIRRYLVRRFPFGIYYTHHVDSVTIWAVFHLSQKPDKWITRLR